MTSFGLLLELSGLSAVEAAAFLKSSPVDVGCWSRGDHIAPDDALEKICDLIANQAQAATEALDMIREHRPEQVELKYPLNDGEARSLGWPCLAAWKAMAARFVAECPSPIILVPRGSTPATTAAASLHNKIVDISAIVERRIRDKLIDNLAPRDCVIPMVWEEALGLIIMLNNSGHTAFADKVLDAFRNAKPSTRV